MEKQSGYNNLFSTSACSSTETLCSTFRGSELLGSCNTACNNVAHFAACNNVTQLPTQTNSMLDTTQIFLVFLSSLSLLLSTSIILFSRRILRSPDKNAKKEEMCRREPRREWGTAQVGRSIKTAVGDALALMDSAARDADISEAVAASKASPRRSLPFLPKCVPGVEPKNIIHQHTHHLDATYLAVTFSHPRRCDRFEPLPPNSSAALPGSSQGSPHRDLEGRAGQETPEKRRFPSIAALSRKGEGFSPTEKTQAMEACPSRQSSRARSGNCTGS